ncbi:hypothetical protein TNCV_1952541 [Trichonephila clavipes]|nr:hypothetical protein TNCV_1952541 [Trichonephila clavipes]
MSGALWYLEKNMASVFEVLMAIFHLVNQWSSCPSVVSGYNVIEIDLEERRRKKRLSWDPSRNLSSIQEAIINFDGKSSIGKPDGRGYELVSSVRAQVPQKFSVEEELMHVKHVDVKRPHVGVMWKFGRGVISSGIVLVT